MGSGSEVVNSASVPYVPMSSLRANVVSSSKVGSRRCRPPASMGSIPLTYRVDRGVADGRVSSLSLVSRRTAA
jgi:hypothetical protein